jgi:hypothetical protein
MKFIKLYNELINESSRFSHLKEVLDTIDDLTLDFKDVGGKVTFGRKSMTTEYQATFDEYLDDISIKMTSMGKNLIFLKFDIKEIKKLPNGKLSDESLELLIETLKSVCNYLVNEDLIVRGFWTKQLVANKNDYGKNTFFRFESIDQLIDDILGKNQIFVKYLLDTRIVFSGQSILEESINVSDSDIEDIKDILDDLDKLTKGNGQSFNSIVNNNLNYSKYYLIKDNRSNKYTNFKYFIGEFKTNNNEILFSIMFSCTQS